MSTASDKTREIFWDMPSWAEALWYVLALLSVVVFAYGVAWRLARYRVGRGGGFGARSTIFARVRGGIRRVFGGASIARRRPGVGVAHRATLLGFTVLFIGTVILAVNVDLTEPVFGWRFFQGNFYLAYSLILDLFGLALLAGLVYLTVRRGRAPVLKRVSGLADWIFLGALLFLVLTGFLLEGVRIDMDSPAYPAYSPVGWVVSRGLSALDVSTAVLGTFRHVLWWVHGLASLTLVAAIPYTKAAHMLTSGASLALKRDDSARRLEPESQSDADAAPGYARIADFSDRHLLQLDACTACGRCHEACPAVVANTALDPREVILGLRDDLDRSMGGVGPGGVLELVLHGNADRASDGRGVEPLADPRAGPDAFWSCMQCNACVVACPVGIEQAPMINQLRRHAIDEGPIDPGIQQVLQSVQRSGNSFGASARKRARWTRELEFEIPDARETPVQMLWFVGDFAAFDSRAQRSTQALARLLRRGEVDFGILYDSERTAGNDVRRVGEEGLFEDLATENISALGGCEFTRIVTSDPHSLNTLRNEYPDYGGRWEIVHHTTVLRDLLSTATLPGAGCLSHRVTYHDPCHLGRMNGGYDDPRAVLELLGCDLLEMPRNRDNSFCCGAGGGQIWMSESQGSPRPAEDRIREARSLGELEYFVVSCPKDVVMYEDAIKAVGGGAFELREITELVEEAVTAQV